LEVSYVYNRTEEILSCFGFARGDKSVVGPRSG
jgi:hypothetical protein